MNEILNYTFMQNALAASFFASIICGIIGTYIVSKRIVFIAGGISHISFGGVGLAFFLNKPPFLFALLFALVSSFGIASFSKKFSIREDSLIGILWSFGMAIGVIFISLTPGYVPNLMTYLFGNILTVSTTDIWIMLVFSVILVVFFVLFYWNILAVSFDEDFAKTQSAFSEVLRYFMLFFVALSVVLLIRIVGIILVIAMLTLPQSMASIFTKDFKRIAVLSMIFAFLFSVVGLALSYNLNIASGASIITTSFLIYITALLIKNVIIKVKGSRSNA